MKSLRRITIVALVMALVAIPTAAFAFDEGTTPTTETDRATTDRPDTDERRHRDLSEIKARALEMIDEGTFGVCQTCGDLIDKERLEEVPHTSSCFSCKTNPPKPVEP